MSLSDEHRRALAEIERALAHDDPAFVATVNPENLLRLRRRWIVTAACLFIIGAALLVAGLVTTHAYLLLGVVVAVVGFLTMPAAVVLVVHQLRRR